MRKFETHLEIECPCGVQVRLDFNGENYDKVLHEHIGRILNHIDGCEKPPAPPDIINVPMPPQTFGGMPIALAHMAQAHQHDAQPALCDNHGPEFLIVALAKGSQVLQPPYFSARKVPLQLENGARLAELGHNFVATLAGL